MNSISTGTLNFASRSRANSVSFLHEGVRAIRRSIQHADERIAKEERVPEGEPLFPAVTNDGIYFAGDHLFFGELAGMVISVWLLATTGIEAATPGT